MDAFLLSRIQFAANISFHILFPTLTISLCWFLLFFKIRFDVTGNEHWLRLYQFWVKIFALTFALGVVSGITMSFQFGTNWPGYMETVGNIAGPLLGYEVLTAFFLEATFLGIMLFGRKRVSNRVHTLATLMVAIGTTLSAFWILALNSWMQTPAGFELRNGVAYPTDWLAILFNPSMPYRMSHMLLASGLTSAFFIAGLSALQQLKGSTDAPPKMALKTALTAAAILIPIQIFVGDLHGLNTLKYQPAKIAAIEGIWQTESQAPLRLFAIPDETARTNHWEISIPSLASLILTHDASGEIKGLNEFIDEHPPVAPLFWGFRLMLTMGILMLVTSWLGVYLSRRTKPIPTWYLKTIVGMTFSGWVATLAGWYVTEIGRQPYLVSGVLKSVDAVTQTPPTNVAVSLSLYLVLYALLLVAYIHTLLFMVNKAITPTIVLEETP